jgi:AraC-like DNA-binding protein
LRYHERAPAADLQGLVECFWSLELDAAPPAAEPQFIFPDGRVELVFHFGERFLRLHDDGRSDLQPRHLVVGQMTRATRLRPSGRAQALGVRLRPGAASAVLTSPLRELRDAILPLDSVELRVPLPTAPLEGVHLAEARVQVLEAWLRTCRDASAPAPAALLASVRAALASGGSRSVDDLLREAGLGARQLERGFERHVGLPPKLFARILRFQSVFAAAGGARPQFTGLALDLGYADQAHLTRDFREFSGTTPAAYFGGERGLAALFTAEQPLSGSFKTRPR